jgi:hypothetical protein
MFEIGQEIVCLETRSVAGVGIKKGKVYTVLDIASCKCDHHVDVGLIAPRNAAFYCGNCSSRMPVTRAAWASSKLFAPLISGSELQKELNLIETNVETEVLA